MQKNKSERAAAVVCLCIIGYFFLSIGAFVFARQVLVKRMGIQNAFTHIVLSERVALEQNDDLTQINWEKLYPFADGLRADVQETTSVKAVRDRMDLYNARVASMEAKVEVYVTELLLFRKFFVNMAGRFSDVIGWHFSYYGGYNEVTVMPDGYLTTCEPKSDISAKAEETISFAQFLQAQGIDFCYVQAPYKVSAYEDTEISGVTDFSNQNADAFLEKLRAQDVDVMDLRETIHDQGLHNHDLFYRTDHHWLTTAGLWASAEILEHINSRYGYAAETARLDLSQFEQVVYPEWFLGSQGKKITLERTSPDDFVLLYPKYETKLHYQVPTRNVDAIGDYSVCYDMTQVETKDYYGASPYAACNYGDRPLIRIENLLDADTHRILIIHDSFGDCVISCLALCEKQIDSLDIRHFDGSVRSFVMQERPDIVLVLYNPSGLTSDGAALNAQFTFR